LPIAPATFYRHAAIARRPELASDRARQDVQDFEKIEATHGKSRGRYGARKIWHQLRRDGHDIARCTVERLMHLHGLQGVVRGQKKTTIPDPAQPCPDDKVNRQFVATMPDQLWGEPLSATGPRTVGERLHLCVDMDGHGLVRGAYAAPPARRSPLTLHHRCLRARSPLCLNQWRTNGSPWAGASRPR
ncbi:IS3 family transposase, partial [Roseovarius sp. SYSU LYC5161]|uniref:IS3 family transposase n=1 Tax=Roseovarius halophilus (ex Wu et al. 2025) TaxID=3376060 RepID=UPI00399C2254